MGLESHDNLKKLGSIIPCNMASNQVVYFPVLGKNLGFRKKGFQLDYFRIFTREKCLEIIISIHEKNWLFGLPGW